MRVHTPAPLTPDRQCVADQAAETFNISLSPSHQTRPTTSAGRTPYPTSGSSPEVGTTLAGAPEPRVHSANSSTSVDRRRCTRCGEQQQYCHGHTPFIPNRDILSPPPIHRQQLQGTIHSNSVARFNLNRMQASALADQLVAALNQGGQDAAEVPPPYDYGHEIARILAEGIGLDPDVVTQGLGLAKALIAKGLGVRHGGRAGQGQGRGNRPNHLQQPRPYQDACPAPSSRGRPARRPDSPVPAGYEHNRGAAYLPFTILNDQGREVPAQYIKVHLDAPNPFLEAKLELNGPVYRGEIHAAPVVDVDTPVPHIDDARLLQLDYHEGPRVEDAL
jgi:hypothetical protein